LVIGDKKLKSMTDPKNSQDSQVSNNNDNGYKPPLNSVPNNINFNNFMPLQDSQQNSQSSSSSSSSSSNVQQPSVFDFFESNTRLVSDFVKSKGFKIVSMEEFKNSEKSEKFQKEKVGCDSSHFYAPSSSSSIPSGSPLPISSSFSFFGNNNSGSNDIASLQNQLRAIQVPKNLVPEQYRTKRGIDINILRATEKESTNIRSGSTSEGEEENENVKVVKYKNGDVQIGTESILGVRRMG
jgi:hypothetical protein